MNIRQAVLGAGVAVFLVLGAGADPARHGETTAATVQVTSSASVCGIAGVKEAVCDAAQQTGAVVLNAVLNFAGELEAHARQIF